MMKREIKIGIFVTIALLIVATFIFIVGDLGVLFRKPGYSIFVMYETATGLEKRAVVRMAGVKVGYVKDIKLKGRKAEVELIINFGIPIPVGSEATMASIGLLGEKHIEILPGEEEEFVKAGDTISGVPPVSFDQMGTTLLAIGDEFKGIAQIISEMIGGEESKNNFRDTLENLALFSEELNEFLRTNKEEVQKGLQSSQQAVQTFEQNVEQVSTNLDELISVLKEAVEESREDIKINMESIKELIKSIEKSLKLLNESLEKINKGEGTLGKLIHQPDLYERAEGAMDDLENIINPISELKLIGGLSAEYYADSDSLKGYFTLEIWPEDDKFVLSQIVYDPWTEKLLFSAQGGLRWGNFAPRLGIMESKIGAGIDYYTLKDRLRFSLEGLDFYRNQSPQVRFRARYSPFKYFQLLLGLDDFTLALNREVFFGIEFGFK
ncbi:MAG: MlaD family protein [Candidatus Aminicenantes bacterium]|jgi:phospholipid/cholesterol/gamma-HCH transport system substrate-binding protein